MCNIISRDAFANALLAIIPAFNEKAGSQTHSKEAESKRIHLAWILYEYFEKLRLHPRLSIHIAPMLPIEIKKVLFHSDSARAHTTSFMLNILSLLWEPSNHADGLSMVVQLQRDDLPNPVLKGVAFGTRRTTLDDFGNPHEFSHPPAFGMAGDASEQGKPDIITFTYTPDDNSVKHTRNGHRIDADAICVGGSLFDDKFVGCTIAEVVRILEEENTPITLDATDLSMDAV